MSPVNIDSQGDTTIGNDVVGRDKIITNIIHEAATPVQNIHQIRSPPPDFTGRELELKELLGHFEYGVAIYGPGGIGKTTLAMKLAEALAPRFPDAQLYVDLHGARDHPISPSDAMAQVIHAYHTTTRLPADEAETGARSIVPSSMVGAPCYYSTTLTAGRK